MVRRTVSDVFPPLLWPNRKWARTRSPRLAFTSTREPNSIGGSNMVAWPPVACSTLAAVALIGLHVLDQFVNLAVRGGEERLGDNVGDDEVAVHRELAQVIVGESCHRTILSPGTRKFE